MEDITFKQVLDSEGSFKYLELWQGENVIKLSLSTSFAGGGKSYIWETLKQTIDTLQETNKNLASLDMLRKSGINLEGKN